MTISRRQFGKLVAAVAVATGLPEQQVVAQLGSSTVAEARQQAEELTTAAQRLRYAETGEPGAIRAFRELTTDDGEPWLVRDELIEPASTTAEREANRTQVACFAHLTDQHIIDPQAPLRVETFRRLGEACHDNGASALQGQAAPADDDRPLRDVLMSSAWRAQEVGCHLIADAMVRRLNRIAVSPVTGGPITAAVCTGDNIDNMIGSELEVHLDVMNGGTVTLNTGDSDAYEGTMRSGDPAIWHPDAQDLVTDGEGASVPDRYVRDFGYPTETDGYVEQALGITREVLAEGLSFPWFACYGNHDALVQGIFPPHEDGLFDDFLLDDQKLQLLPFLEDPEEACDLLPALLQAFDGTDDAFGAMFDETIDRGGAMTVTPDEGRGILDRTEWVTAHLQAGGEPAGHGFTEDNLHGGMTEDGRTLATAYYAHDLTGPDGHTIRLISLDTVNHGGVANGSLGAEQLRWLDDELAAADAAGKVAVLFSHHGLRSLELSFGPVQFGSDLGEFLDNIHEQMPFLELEGINSRLAPQVTDPVRVTIHDPLPTGEDWPAHWQQLNADADEHGISAIEMLVASHPCAIAWVSGHTHDNVITPRRGFWDVGTAAHIDWPCQSRLIDVADNHDGTWSIICTIVDHAGYDDADAHPEVDDWQLQAADFSRQLAANDPDRDLDASEGGPQDRNVELLIAEPFPERASARRVPAQPAAQADRSLADGPLPAGITVGGALALAGLIGVRRLHQRAVRHGHVDPATGTPTGPRGEPRR